METDRPGEAIGELRDGLSTVMLPNLIDSGPMGDSFVSPDEVLKRMNEFTEKLNEQSAQIVHVFEQTVNLGRRGGIAGTATGTRTFAIVNKSAK